MPFGDHATEYVALGWTPLPVPYRSKVSPPKGYTGREGKWPTAHDTDGWRATHVGDNIALRMPPTVMGIDVDDYAPKRGGESFAYLLERYGPLPPTWMSTSRAGTSGIRFYRVPADVEFPGTLSPDIEAIQWFHRYAVVWPSMHPDGREYRWVSPDGEIGADPPSVDDLPDLPQAWLEGLRRRPGEDQGERLRRDGEPSKAVAAALGTGLMALRSAGSRHDNTCSALIKLVRLADLDHPGAEDAIAELRDAFMNIVTADHSRTPSTAEAEWKRMLEGAEDKVSATAATRPKWDDIERSTMSDWADFSAPRQSMTEIDDEGLEEPPGSPLVLVLRDRTLTVDQAMELQPPPPLVDGWLYRNTNAMSYGPSGGGKTFLLVDITCHVVTGSWWLGRKVHAGPVLYIAAEGAHGLGQRFKAWGGHHGVTLSNHHPIHILTVAPRLLEQKWADALAQHAKDLEPVLIVIDTLARASVGAEENSAKDMGIVFEHLDWIRRATEACVLVNHHTGKDTTAGARGSSALRAAMDTELEILGSEGYVRVRTTKQKDAPEASEVSFKLMSSGPSAVVVPSVLSSFDEVPPSVDDVLSDLREIATPDGVTANEWATYCIESGRSRTSFYRARGLLVSQGLVVNVGSEARPRFIPATDTMPRNGLRSVPTGGEISDPRWDRNSQRVPTGSLENTGQSQQSQPVPVPLGQKVPSPNPYRGVGTGNPAAGTGDESSPESASTHVVIEGEW